MKGGESRERWGMERKLGHSIYPWSQGVVHEIAGTPSHKAIKQLGLPQATLARDGGKEDRIEKKQIEG